MEFPVVGDVAGRTGVDETFCGRENGGGYEAVGRGERGCGEELFDFEGSGERRGL